MSYACMKKALRENRSFLLPRRQQKERVNTFWFWISQIPGKGKGKKISTGIISLPVKKA
jgi:hypothetical protein